MDEYWKNNPHPPLFSLGWMNCLSPGSLFLAMWLQYLDLLCFTCVLSVGSQSLCSHYEAKVLSSVCWLAGWLAGHKNNRIEFSESCWGNWLNFGAHLDEGNLDSIGLFIGTLSEYLLILLLSFGILDLASSFILDLRIRWLCLVWIELPFFT